MGVLTEDTKFVGVGREDGQDHIERDNWLQPPLDGTAERRSGQMFTFIQLKRKPLYKIFFPFVFCSSLLWHSPSPAFPRP